jgi:copper/silver efflux system protein
MRQTAAPMVGGMITAPLLNLFVIPAIYLVWRRRELAQAADGAQPDSPAGLGAPGS